jgi:hypothetical protein
MRTRRAVLAHEFAHIRRRDTWTSALTFVARSLLWFHPLAWWVRRETAQLAELACDLVALETAKSPAAYAELLLDWAKAAKRAGSRVSMPGLAVARSAGLRRRIDQALAFSQSVRRPRGVGVILAIAGVPAISLAAAVTLIERPAEVSGPGLSVPRPSSAAPQLGGEQTAETPRDPATVAVITGRLLLSDGAPAPDIEIRAWQEDVPPEGATAAWTIVGRTRTDANGRYRVEIPAGGIYGVEGGTSNFPTFYPGVTATKSARLVPVAAGQTVSSIDFALDRTSGVRVRGRIVPPPGVGAAAVHVGLGDLDSPGPDPGSLFDFSRFNYNEYYPAIGLRPVAADGSFEFPLVPQGTYAARVFPHSPAYPTGHSPEYAGRRIMVRDAEVTGVEISAPGNVTGQIHDKAGSPAASIRILAIVADASSATGTETPIIARQTQTAADGRYRLDGLPSGRYFIQAGSPNLLGYFPGVSALTEARALDVASGGAVANADFRLVSDGVRITGHVTGIPAEAMRDSLKMTLLGPNQTIFSAEARKAPVGPDGAFQFSAIPSGTYGLVITGQILLKFTDPNDPHHTGIASGVGAAVAVLRVDGQRDIDGIELPFARMVHPPTTEMLKMMPRLQVVDDFAKLVNFPRDGMATVPVPAYAAPPLFRVRGRVVAIPGVELPRQIYLRSYATDAWGTRGVAAEIRRDGSFEFQRVPEGDQDLVLEDWQVAPGETMPLGHSFTLKADVDGLEFHLPTQVSGRAILDGGAAMPAGATILAQRSPNALRDSRTTNNETLQPFPIQVAPDGSFQLLLNGGEPTITLIATPGYAIAITVGPRTFLDGVLPIDGTLLKTPIEIRLRRLP